MSNEWNTNLLSGIYFESLKQLFALDKQTDWPSAKWLTKQIKTFSNAFDIQFVDNDQYSADGRYYEEIIFDDHCVPTRSKSWHDLFNALIWTVFPASKRLLNQQHIEDIRAYGLTPRTQRRNHITHFDECGIVLAYVNQCVPQWLTEHNWKKAFVESQSLWDVEVKPFVFGHANYEMLLSPFLGLTGKWLGGEVQPVFFDMDLAEQYRYLDICLANQITDNALSHKGCLKPFPLLGGYLCRLSLTAYWQQC